MIMIIGYGIIAVPTGIVSAEYASGMTKEKTLDPGRACPNCGSDVLQNDAHYCRQCGHRLSED
jgi:voltage-gated potassium channel